jgi:tetratricopeptide (TPR) repeat protein
MHQRKSNRRYIVILATSLSLLTMLAPQMSLAQIMPGLPPTPVMAPPVKVAAVQQAQVPTLYTDINVQVRMHTVAQPYSFPANTPYFISEKLLTAQIQVLNTLAQTDTVEMAALMNNLGWVQEHLGKMTDAEHSYKVAIGIFSSQGRALAAQTAVVKYNLAELYSAEHRVLDALHFYRQALEEIRKLPAADRANTEQQIELKYDVVRKLLIARR